MQLATRGHAGFTEPMGIKKFTLGMLDAQFGENGVSSVNVAVDEV